MQHSKFQNFKGGEGGNNIILWTNMVRISSFNDLLTFFTQ